MKSFKFIYILFLLFFGLQSPNYSQTNKIVQINGRVKDVNGGCAATNIRIFNSSRKQIGTETSDNNGIFQLNLQYNNEYYILFNCKNYNKQFRLVYISTVGFENISKKVFDLPTIIGANQIAKADTIQLQTKEPTMFFFYSNKVKDIEFSSQRPTSQIPNSISENKSLKKGSIVKKDGKIIFYLSIRAADGNKSFNECKMIQNGKVILNPSQYSNERENSDSALLLTKDNHNMEIYTVCRQGSGNDPRDENMQILIDCPGFFKKTLYVTLYGLFHKFNCKQLSPDTINILLDSSFNADRKPAYFGANYYYSGRGVLERNKKLQSYESESVKRYRDMVERAKAFRNEYYQSAVIQEIKTSKQIEGINSYHKNTAEESQLEEPDVEELQLLASNVIFDMDSIDAEHPVKGKIEEVIFKNQAPNLLPEKTKKKFEKFGFDTLKLYTERKVKQQLKLLEKSTSRLKTAEDTLILYSQLYKLNNDFIFIGKKRIEELSSDTGNRILIEEIKKGVDEKEMENYFIRKEVNDLKQKLKNKTLELQNERNKFLFVGILLLISIGFSIALFHQNKKVKELNTLLKFNINEIKESINYAKRIQDAILPQLQDLKLAFSQSFILFKPKDIVSGDFYWFQEVDGKKYIAACDCTGHGVPGALMSMVATDMLNEALVHTKKVDEILAHTNRSIRVALKQSTDDDSTRDGMDIALCCFNDKTNVVQFAGAYRPLWLIRSSQLEQIEAFKNKYELIEYKATKAAIGGLTEDNQVFQINEIQLQKGDTIYLSSDGYADQFSPNDKKLMTKRFKEILLSIQHLSMPEQGNYLEKFITDWRGNMEQTDDVLVIGVRV